MGVDPLPIHKGELANALLYGSRITEGRLEHRIQTNQAVVVGNLPLLGQLGHDFFAQGLAQIVDKAVAGFDIIQCLGKRMLVGGVGEEHLPAGHGVDDGGEIMLGLFGHTNRCRSLLTENRQALDLVARSLLEHETIDGAEVRRLITVAGGTPVEAPNRSMLTPPSEDGSAPDTAPGDPSPTEGPTSSDDTTSWDTAPGRR